jgi:hypothetical protein
MPAARLQPHYGSLRLRRQADNTKDSMACPGDEVTWESRDGSAIGVTIQSHEGSILEEMNKSRLNNYLQISLQF